MSGSKRKDPDAQERCISPPKTKRKLVQTDVDSVSDPSSSLSGLRIFSWNVNGVGPLIQKRLSFEKNSLTPLRAFLKRHAWPQVLCLQEVKIRPQDSATQRRVLHAANSGAASHEPTYVSHFSLPRDKHNATGFGGKVYGVATLIRSDTASTVKCTRRPSWDLEGRVLVHDIGDSLVIVNGYWVNGTFNPYRDPDTGVESGTRHDHKLRFHRHMLDDCLELQRRGKHVILIGDINIARSRLDGHPNLRTSPEQHVRNRADFNECFIESDRGFRGIDVFRHLHGTTRKYTYYSRNVPWGQSCDRVDNVIVSRTLIEPRLVIATDICDNPQDRGHSDHVPLWVSIDWSKMMAARAQPGLTERFPG